MQLDERKLGEVKKKSTHKTIKKHTTSSTAYPRMPSGFKGYALFQERTKSTVYFFFSSFFNS